MIIPEGSVPVSLISDLFFFCFCFGLLLGMGEQQVQVHLTR